MAKAVGGTDGPLVPLTIGKRLIKKGSEAIELDWVLLPQEQLPSCGLITVSDFKTKYFMLEMKAGWILGPVGVFDAKVKLPTVQRLALKVALASAYALSWNRACAQGQREQKQDKEDHAQGEDHQKRAFLWESSLSIMASLAPGAQWLR